MTISPQIAAAAASTRSESEVRQQRTLSMVDVIGKAALPRGMSDDQLDNEHRAQNRLAKAVTEMWDAIAYVNEYSAVVTISLQSFNDFLHDDLPTEDMWDEKIADARS